MYEHWVGLMYLYYDFQIGVSRKEEEKEEETQENKDRRQWLIDRWTKWGWVR